MGDEGAARLWLIRERKLFAAQDLDREREQLEARVAALRLRSSELRGDAAVIRTALRSLGFDRDRVEA